jgi:hypothetical protein
MEKKLNTVVVFERNNAALTQNFSTFQLKIHLKIILSTIGANDIVSCAAACFWGSLAEKFPAKTFVLSSLKFCHPPAPATH